MSPNTLLEGYLEELNEQGFEITAEQLKQAAQSELKRKELAFRYLEDPWLWQKHVACPPQFRHHLADIHKDGLRWIQGGKHKKLILWPRGHIKTGCFTVGETLRRVVKNPNYRVLLDTFKWDNSKTFLAGIKGVLDGEDFINLYGNLRPDAKSGMRDNLEQLTITTRKNSAIKEPNFSTSGMDKTQTSQHYDLIVIDDLMTRENITNDEQMDKCIKHYKDCLSLLDPGGEIWVIGTRWHHLDLYGFIIENYVEEKCQQADYVHQWPCKCTFDVTHKEIEKDGAKIFPTRFTPEYVEELRIDLGPVDFALQYLNQPAASELCWFPHPLIDKALVPPTEIDAIRNNLLWFMATDPAESLETRADFTAIVGVGVNMKTGMWYVDYAKQMKVETPGLVDAVFYAHKLYKPTKFGMDLHTRKANSYALKDAMIQRGYMFTIEEFKMEKYGAGQRSKELRIKRLLPLFEFGRIKINNTLKDLIDTLYTIPASRSKDLPDALSYILDLVPEGIGSVDTGRPKRIIRKARIGL